MSSLSFSPAIGRWDRSSNSSSGVGFNPIGSISSSSSSSSSFPSSLHKNGGGGVGGNGQRGKKACLVVRCQQQEQPPQPPPRGPMQTWKLVLGKLKMRKRKHVDRWWVNIDPNIKSGYLKLLCPWKPLPYKPKPIILPFEKPLRNVEKHVIEMREISKELGPEFERAAASMEKKYRLAVKIMYTFLTPIQRVQIARHPHRPTFYDHILNMTDKWLELHGDRAGYDDPAIVTGLGSINGKTYMFIGHQKGRNTRENIKRNFGMPTPHGYRKALRLMRYAEHHGFPIVTMIDTPGAFADLKSEELGQGEAIAFNLREMFSLKVPVVSIVIGEGGSGGALAIGVGNRLYMLENAIFYVASPEACAAILYKSSSAAPKAASKLKITARELCKLNIADGVIREPFGGAHNDPLQASQRIKTAIIKSVEALETMDPDSLIEHRRAKYRHIGGFEIKENLDPYLTRNMKKREVAVSKFGKRLEVDLEKLKEAHASMKNKLVSSKEEAKGKMRDGGRKQSPQREVRPLEGLARKKSD